MCDCRRALQLLMMGILESPFEELILCIASILKDLGLSQASFVRALLFNADNNRKDGLVLCVYERKYS